MMKVLASRYVLIQDHHTTFRDLYPDANVIPKMHYIVHMPRLIMEFGPLVRHWTMHYEARHNYFKKLAQNIGNYINISWTLAMRHQLLQCYHSFNPDEPFEDNPEVCAAIRDRPDELATCSECYRAKWVKVAGITYKKPCALLVGVEDESPQFGLLQGIYVADNNRVVFRVRLYN